MGNVFTQTMGSKIIPFINDNNNNNDNENQCVICLDTYGKRIFIKIKKILIRQQLFVKCFICNLTVHYICEQQWLHDKNFVKCIHCQNIGTGYVSTSV